MLIKYLEVVRQDKVAGVIAVGAIMGFSRDTCKNGSYSGFYSLWA
ncbi:MULTISPECIES: hypothetical protein [Bacillus cereus group]|nr:MULTISPECIES: hypothetical protein [Bacillus cereus group]MEB9673372.1 hypothetical protein [Bacillus anthracis]